MNSWEILLLGAGLSMDAFAVSLCKGLAVQRADGRTALTCGAWFGFFQGLMPAIGFFLGKLFAAAIQAFDHWVAFGLLVLVGGNMIREAFDPDESGDASAALSPGAMLPLAVATSIDALAVGLSLAMVEGVHLWCCVSTIAVTTALLSGAGAIVGGTFGRKMETKAQLVGGLVLILLGCKMLLEGLVG